MTRKRMEALRYPAADMAAVSELVFLHLRFHTYKMGWSDSAVRRYVRDAGDLLPQLHKLTRADCTTRNARKAAALRRTHQSSSSALARSSPIGPSSSRRSSSQEYASPTTRPGGMPRVAMIWLPSRSGRIAASSSAAASSAMRRSRSS